jgi:shikimate dehydrogenase
MPILNKDMQVCISLAARPSNLGTRFHNFLYDELGLNIVYKAFTTTDLEGAVRGMRALNLRGCSVSMPFKEAIIEFVDVMAPSALAIESVNTVVNDNGVLTASNTDFEAVLNLLRERGLDPSLKVLLRGSGGMAKAVAAAFKEAGFENLTIQARNAQAGEALATKLGFDFVSDADLAVSEGLHFDVLVNVTPIGMSGANEGELSFTPELIAAAQVVFDVVAFPAETPLIVAARAAGKSVITGAEVIALQAALQFEAYTGVALSAEQVRRASEFSRQPA